MAVAVLRVVSDITQYDTFQNLSRWVDKVNNEADKNCSIILVGNKRQRSSHRTTLTLPAHSAPQLGTAEEVGH